MTPRQPTTPPDSEAELFEQWSVLDRLVERQAAQLRAGIQDAEDVDDPAPGIAEAQSQQRELGRLRHELLQAEAARQSSEAAFRSAETARQSAEAVARLALDGERRWQGRAAAMERELQEVRPDGRDEIASLRLRLAEAETALRHAEASHAEMLETLRGAHLEVESLRRQVAEAPRGFWHLRRH